MGRVLRAAGGGVLGGKGAYTRKNLISLEKKLDKENSQPVLSSHYARS